ncbi:MAG: RHS repeat-associated core domain-containing protein [Syntrophobacteraceae bacterium]
METLKTDATYGVDGSSVVRETVTRTGQAPETVTYLTGANGPIYRRSGAGVKTWYAYDGLGSVVGEISGSTGDLAKARVYDVYGTVRAEDNATSASKHRFVGALGHPSEGETGLIYMRARFMDPATGRFISEDPAKDGVNWFVYCNNDPVNRLDQNGQFSLLATGIYTTMFALALNALGFKDTLAGQFAKAFAGFFDSLAATQKSVQIYLAAAMKAEDMETRLGNVTGLLTGMSLMCVSSAMIGLFSTLALGFAIEIVALSLGDSDLYEIATKITSP